MPAGRTNAKALLQKVNSQLRGERVPIKTNEEDELALYLQSISQKTQQTRNVGFEEYGDISISSGVQSVTPRGHRTASPAASAPTQTNSKFLKKKKPAKGVEKDNEVEKNYQQIEGIVIAGKKRVNDLPSKPLNERHATVAALDKANALTKKISSWSSRGHLRYGSQSVDSDTDESVRVSEAGKRPGSADTSIGRDGNKFLKSSKRLPADNKIEKRSPSPQLNYQRSLSSEKNEPHPKSTKTKGEIVRTLGTVFLTSEEESLAEFIHGLSASESLKKPQNLVTKKQQKWRKKSPSPSGRQSPSIHMSRSPSPFKNQSPSPYGRLSRSQSQDSDLVESMASEVMEIKRHEDSASSGDRFGVNLMDISSLLPAESSHATVDQQSKKQKKKKTQKKSQSSTAFAFKHKTKVENRDGSKKQKQKETSSSNSKNNFFESLGIQMVDDIFDSVPDAKVEREEDISHSEDSEIKTENSDDRRRSRLQRQESVSEIITELGGRSAMAHESMEEFISEKIKDAASLSDVKSASYSADDSGTEMDADYSETFVSESETVGRHKSQRSDSTSAKSGKEKSSRRKHKGTEKKVVIEEKTVDIATADEHGYTHHYNTTQTGISVTPSYGLQYVDPTPVCAHVINADALEALTAYSPNMLALQDMMRSQLQLVKQFMEIQNRIYHSCMDGLSEDFHYTTLEDTKEYINKHRKPRMTFDEALKLVDLEGNM